MNAKITLTVPMEKIPREVNRLLDDVAMELEDLLYTTKECASSDDILGKIQVIDNIRKRLSSVDFTYEDCYTILLGYAKYEAQKNQQGTQQEQNNDKQSNG
jgi:hypothetical protein